MKPIQSLLVYVEDNTSSDARLEMACDLADRFDARVIGVSASEPQPPMYDPLGGPAEVLVAPREAAEDDVRRARARFDAIVAARGVRSEWRGQVGAPATFVVREARCADLVILGPKTASAPYRTPDPADIVMAIGRPVLVTPERYEGSCLDGLALVAWKDTREAQRAVATALPLLREAVGVQVLEISSSDAAAAAASRVEDVAHYLARHDIKAEARVIVDEERMRSDVIRREAADTQANLIVIGGYGHSRLREWALGGVTRELFSDCAICLLVSH